MPKVATNPQTSSTTSFYEARRATPTAGSVPVSVTRAQRSRKTKAVETAVYTHIQALRALGKTQVNTAEIARALGLSVSNVDSVISRLNEKGVRQAG